MSSAFCQYKNNHHPHPHSLSADCTQTAMFSKPQSCPVRWLSLSILVVQTQYFSSSKIAVYYYWHCWLKNVLTNLTILQQFGLSWWGLLMLVFLNVKLFISHWLTDDQSMTSMGFSAAGKSQYLESNSETVGLSWIPSGRQLRPIVYQCHLLFK